MKNEWWRLIKQSDRLSHDHRFAENLDLNPVVLQFDR